MNILLEIVKEYGLIGLFIMFVFYVLLNSQFTIRAWF